MRWPGKASVLRTEWNRKRDIPEAYLQDFSRMNARPWADEGPGLVKSRQPGCLECGKEEAGEPGKFRQSIRASVPWSGGW